MFSVIISEKGGAERRETFDRTEINVGRVQGNDLMLPKGNVSKRHARLLYRDGRFIVTDLKSTNGTYVNGRKIAQATIVREGDKIYIGDFVLKIEAAPSVVAPDSTSPPRHGEDELNASAPDPASPLQQQMPDHPPLGPPSSAEKGLAPRGAPHINEKLDLARTGGQIVSHFPLENDPDESAPDGMVPGPPRVPSPRPVLPPLSIPPISPVPSASPAPPAPLLSPSSPVPPASSSPGAPPTPLTPGMSRTASMPAIPAHSSTPGPRHVSTGSFPAVTVSSTGTSTSALPGTGRRAMPPASERGNRQPEGQHAAAHLRALGRLLERLREGIDLAALDAGGAPDEALARRIEQRLGEAAAAMRAAGEIPAEVDGDALVAEARRELLQLGPLDLLLAEEDVSEIQVFRHDYVVGVQGRRLLPAEVAFSSEAAVARAIRRLCAATGQPLRDDERFVERRLPQGGRVFAVLPPASTHGHTLVIRKPQRADLTLEDLVRSGTISRAMAGLLSQCVLARGNILVTGTRGSGTTSLLGALAAAGNADDRVVVLQEDDELILNQPHTISILLGEGDAERAQAVRAAARIQPDRLVIGAFAGRVAAEVVDAIGDGIDGVLAAARAPTLRQAAARLTADLAATKSGLVPETAREWLSSAFDLVIEIARLRDGRHRVLRIAEFAVEAGHIAIRDIFTFAVERTAAGGALEGTFHPSGLIPGIVEDLAARGTPVDTSAFRRTR